jgi:Type II CAAX prenyl endopeptidase Rce1-like
MRLRKTSSIIHQIIFVVVLVGAVLGSTVTFADSESIFDYKIRNSEQRSSVYWFPLASLFLPGLDQFLNNQIGAGVMYTSIAGAGYIVYSIGDNRHDSTATDSDEFQHLSIGDEERLWGSQTYQDSGFLSAYHAFRSTVQQREEKGDFDFLKRPDKSEETTDQLMLAPFHFQYLARPTTFIPLGLVALAFVASGNDATSKNYLTTSDGLFAFGVSYNAGVSEEAFFRGYLMMNMRQSWGSNLWSNLGSSLVFGAAHISSANELPLPQFLLGTYLAWLAQRNDWTLAEGVFIHAWWDVIAISASLIDNSTVNKTIRLPAFTMTF